MEEQIVLFVETLGTRSTSAIIQIGAASSKGRWFEKNIKIDDSLRLGLTVDEDTLKFWLKQSEEARLSMSKKGDWVRDALWELTWWLNGHEPSFKGNLWTLRSQFHIPILAHAYEKVGLDVPWHYQAPKCLRTLAVTAPEAPPECTMIALKDAILHLDWLMRQLQMSEEAFSSERAPASV